MKVTDFRNDFKTSNEPKTVAAITKYLLEYFPYALSVYQSDETADRKGCDYWVEQLAWGTNRLLAIDAKVRRIDFLEANGQDDLCLELWSNYERGKVGWTLKQYAITDYILWYWVNTNRFELIPFKPLRSAFQKHLDSWLLTYKTKKHKTSNYTSECIFVPRQIVLQAVKKEELKVMSK